MEVELHPAYTWDCDNCGRENVVRPMPAFFDEEKEQEAREDWGIEPQEEGVFLQIPAEVTCKFCDSTYGAIPPIDLDTGPSNGYDN